MDELANIFKALGDETRLRIMALLLHHGELCVCDLENVIGASQSKTSRHLRYLLHAGLVRDRREGVWSYYRLAGESDDRIKLLRATLKKLLTPELIADLEKSFQGWCCAPGSNCSPAAKAVAGKPAALKATAAAK